MPLTRILKTQKADELPLSDAIALLLLFFFLLTEVLGGAIRYYAVQFHMTWLPYFPHLLLVLALVPMFFFYLASEGVTSTYLAVFALFSVGIVYGVFNLNSASQVEFGFWIFAAFLYGIVALPAMIHGWRGLTPYVLILWAIAVAGVLINFFHAWPWIGLEYQVGANSIQASRLWRIGTLNVARLPGFSRASFAAALQILISCVFLSGTLRRKWWIPVWAFSGAAIALTTSKVAIVIFVLFSISRAFRRNCPRPFWRRVVVALVCLDILLPFSMLFIRLDWLRGIRAHLWVVLIASFVARMQQGWPIWLHMIVEHGNVFLGRGLGGIGSAQRYFEPALYSPGDNIAVYLYGTFGVLGLFLLCMYARNAARVRVNGQVGRFFFLCACLVLLDGITVNVLEGPFIALIFGASLRYLQESPLRATSPLPGRVRRRGAFPSAHGAVAEGS